MKSESKVKILRPQQIICWTPYDIAILLEEGYHLTHLLDLIFPTECLFQNSEVKDAFVIYSICIIVTFSFFVPVVLKIRQMYSELRSGCIKKKIRMYVLYFSI